MNKTTGYAIDYINETIIITKSFAKAAGNMNSPEFRTMQQLRKECAGFSIEYKTIKKKENKNSYGGLKIAEMKRFLADKPVELEKLEKVIAIAENKRGKYPMIKKWFLDNFKDEYNAEIEAIKKEEAAEIKAA